MLVAEKKSREDLHLICQFFKKMAEESSRDLATMLPTHTSTVHLKEQSYENKVWFFLGSMDRKIPFNIPAEGF